MLKHIVTDADENCSVADCARIAVAMTFGAIIALLVVQIGRETGVILPVDVYWMNEVVGLPIMIITSLVAGVALNKRHQS